MKYFEIEYLESDPHSHYYEKNSMNWLAEDELHAINQLLDFYKDLTTRVVCIERINSF
jgi:hypothetical protein